MFAEKRKEGALSHVRVIKGNGAFVYSNFLLPTGQADFTLITHCMGRGGGGGEGGPCLVFEGSLGCSDAISSKTQLFYTVFSKVIKVHPIWLAPPFFPFSLVQPERHQRRARARE
jgi:hypothetical protein